MTDQDAPRSSSPDHHDDAASDAGSAIAELNAAIAADPSLRATTPAPQAEWEDFDKLVAENPELGAPVASNKKKEYYMSKTKWECNHESDPFQTDIERDADTEEDAAMLINEVKGICPMCMEKWVKLESKDPGTNDGLASCSGDFTAPAPPAYVPDHDYDDPLVVKKEEDEQDQLRARLSRLEIDEGPSKGKGTAADTDDADDDRSDGQGGNEYSSSLGDSDEDDSQGHPPQSHKDDSDDDEAPPYKEDKDKPANLEV